MLARRCLEDEKMGPLEGVKVIEIAGIGPGPFAEPRQSAAERRFDRSQRRFKLFADLPQCVPLQVGPLDHDAL